MNVIRDRPDYRELAAELSDLGASVVTTEGHLKAAVNELGSERPRLGLNCVGGSSATAVAKTLRYLIVALHAFCFSLSPVVEKPTGADFGSKVFHSHVSRYQGTMVTYGGMSMKPVSVPTSLLIFNDLQLRGFWLSKSRSNNIDEARLARHTLFWQAFDMSRTEGVAKKTIPVPV